MSIVYYLVLSNLARVVGKIEGNRPLREINGRLIAKFILRQFNHFKNSMKS